MSLIDRLLTAPQYVVPHHTLSRLAWAVARNRNKRLKDVLIDAFMRHYGIDLGEAVRDQARDYASFNDFFTRALRPGTRPQATARDAVLSPADGTISELGRIDQGSLLQAKGRYYSLHALLAGDEALHKRFTGGSFATIYLAPHNYHRVHAPVGATVERVRYVPGRLFSVNNRTARCVDGLFARNERLIIELDSEAGYIAVILVGAMLVSSMELTFCDVAAALESNHGGQPFVIEQDPGPVVLERGAELGRFNMGSTVILLAESGRLDWDAALEHGSEIRFGQAIATVAPAPD